MTMPNITPGRPELRRSGSRASFDNNRPDASLLQRRDHRLSMSQAAMLARVSPAPNKNQNLDYLSLSNTPTGSHPPSPVQARMQQVTSAANSQLYSQLNQKVSGVSASDWEALLGQMDGGQLNVYDAIYGGPALSLTETPVSASSNYGGWSPDSIDLSSFNLGDFGSNPAPAQSVLSFSDESLSSGEEIAPSELGLSVSSLDYRNSGLLHTSCTTTEGFILDGLDGNFGL